MKTFHVYKKIEPETVPAKLIVEQCIFNWTLDTFSVLYSKLQKVTKRSLFSLFRIVADLNANHILPQGCAFMFGLKNENIGSAHFLVALHLKTVP